MQNRNKELSEMAFRAILGKISTDGREVSPRGLKIKEIENCKYTLAPYVRFPSFKSRKLSIDYIKREFLWYLKGDKYDDSITEHASMWESIQNSDGSFNSNYGQYFFGKENQFDRIVDILHVDKDSRRASVLLLNKDHVASDTKDVPCTYALNFRIRDGYLNMTVHMRSQDAIYGMGNDAPAFSFIHEMVLNALREWYPELQFGIYCHFTDSLHVYEKHFNMLNKIVNENDEYVEIECPQMSGPDEVKFLREMAKGIELNDIPAQYIFTKWLTTFKNV